MGKNFIGLKNHFTLSKWLEGNTAKLAELTRPEAVALATKELGFLITENNMAGAIEAAGLEIKFRRMTNNCSAPTRETKKSAYTAAALLDLMEALSFPQPAYLKAIVDGLPMDVVDHLYNKAHNRTSS
jgi:hypothetical protein